MDVRRPRPVRPGEHDRGRRGRRARSLHRAARSASSRGARSRTWCAWASRSRSATASPPATTCCRATTRSRRAAGAGTARTWRPGQDWSSFRGIRLAWYASQPTRPASPTAGDDIKIELKDGGPDGEHSEVWAATFKDNWSSDGSRWKIVDLPFSQFTLSGYQPGDAATRNGILDLTSAWGYAVTFVPGTATPVSWAIDDVQLYGSAVPAPTATVGAPDVVLVDPGETAQVPVTLTTTDGQPLPADVDRRVRERRRHRGRRHALRRVLRHAHVPRGHGVGRDADDRRGHARDRRGRRRPHAGGRPELHGCGRRHHPEGRPQRGRRGVPRPDEAPPTSGSRTCSAG